VEEDEETEEAGENADQESRKHLYTNKMDQKERDSADLEGKEKSLNVVQDEKKNELAGLVGKKSKKSRFSCDQVMKPRWHGRRRSLQSETWGKATKGTQRNLFSCDKTKQWLGNSCLPLLY